MKRVDQKEKEENKILVEDVEDHVVAVEATDIAAVIVDHVAVEAIDVEDIVVAVDKCINTRKSAYF